MRLPRYEVEHLAKEGEGCDLDESRADRKEGKFQCTEEFFLFVRHKKHLTFAPYFSTKGGKSQEWSFNANAILRPTPSGVILERSEGSGRCQHLGGE